MHRLSRHCLTRCQAQPSGYLEPPVVPRGGCAERQALERPPCQEEDGPAAFPCRLKSGREQQRRLRGARGAEQQQRRPGNAVRPAPTVQHPPQRLRHVRSAADQSGLRCRLGPAHTEASLATVDSDPECGEEAAGGRASGLEARSRVQTRSPGTPGL